MNILVLNGSPKGPNSITLQTVNYLRELCGKHRFEVFHVGQKIRSLEKDMTPAIELLEKADLILFSYPVYTFLAPYQLQRFIELVKESGICLKGKAVTQITTSKHFYDVTAHRYIEDNCHDMGMNYIRGLSADMEDLLSTQGRKEAREFMNRVFWSIREGIFEPDKIHGKQKSKLIPATPLKYEGSEKTGDIVIVADLQQGDTQLQGMIKRFQAAMPRKTRIVNIREFPFIGGCLGCFHCAVSGKCVYTDHFDEFLRNNIQTAEAIVYAFRIQDHSMGSRFKLYDDRQFCNGHRTVTMGMPMGYLVSGHYGEESNLQMVVEARSQVGGNFLAGVACDEQNTDLAIDNLAKTLDFALKKHYREPQNFFGVGGMKIFRDLIWIMQGMMKADHKFYKEHGQYDFPQKHKGTILKMYLVGMLMSSPKLKQKMGTMMTDGMLMPYRKVIEQAAKYRKNKK